MALFHHKKRKRNEHPLNQFTDTERHQIFSIDILGFNIMKCLERMGEVKTNVKLSMVCKDFKIYYNSKEYCYPLLPGKHLYHSQMNAVNWMLNNSIDMSFHSNQYGVTRLPTRLLEGKPGIGKTITTLYYMLECMRIETKMELYNTNKNNTKRILWITPPSVVHTIKNEYFKFFNKDELAVFYVSDIRLGKVSKYMESEEFKKVKIIITSVNCVDPSLNLNDGNSYLKNIIKLAYRFIVIDEAHMVNHGFASSLMLNNPLFKEDVKMFNNFIISNDVKIRTKDNDNTINVNGRVKHLLKYEKVTIDDYNEQHEYIGNCRIKYDSIVLLTGSSPKFTHERNVPKKDTIISKYFGMNWYSLVNQMNKENSTYRYVIDSDDVPDNGKSINTKVILYQIDQTQLLSNIIEYSFECLKKIAFAIPETYNQIKDVMDGDNFRYIVNDNCNNINNNCNNINNNCNNINNNCNNINNNCNIITFKSDKTGYDNLSRFVGIGAEILKIANSHKKLLIFNESDTELKALKDFLIKHMDLNYSIELLNFSITPTARSKLL